MSLLLDGMDLETLSESKYQLARLSLKIINLGASTNWLLHLKHCFANICHTN